MNHLRKQKETDPRANKALRHRVMRKRIRSKQRASKGGEGGLVSRLIVSFIQGRLFETTQEDG